LPEKGLWVVLCGLQDPGNVGAVVRCVHAAGWSGVLVDSCADPFSPKGIRASAGSVFHVDVRHASLVTLRDWKGRGAWLAGADVHGAGADMRPMAGKNPAALVLGAEGAGLSEEAASLCDAMVKVPLASGCESLNVAAACAVLLYSWGRFNLDAEVSR
jgi:TrmH family RNA methyltransferase